MIGLRARSDRGERGAALILAIVFVVVVGAIVAATLAMITSGLNNRTALDGARDREYAADGAIEYSIAQVRDIGGSGPAKAPCGPYLHSVNNVTIRVDCFDSPTTTYRLLQQLNVIFTACEDPTSDLTSAASCGTPTTPVLIRAQVNFQAVSTGGAPVVVTRTWIQSWSVDG